MLEAEKAEVARRVRTMEGLIFSVLVGGTAGECVDHRSQHCVRDGLMDGERSLVTQSCVWHRISVPPHRCVRETQIAALSEGETLEIKCPMENWLSKNIWMQRDLRKESRQCSGISVKEREMVGVVITWVSI